MPGAASYATTFNTPNYVGELTQVTPTDTPFTTIIAGMTGGGGITASEKFDWQFADLRTNGPRAAKEGADAPAASSRTRFNVSNVVQAIHESVGVTYRRQATPHDLAAGVDIIGQNPVLNELTFQQNSRLQEIKLDMEWNLLRSRFYQAQNTNEVNTTRGFLPAIQKNRVTASSQDDEGDLDLGGANNNFTVTVANPGVFTLATGHGLAVGDQIQFTEGDGVLPKAVQLGDAALDYRLEESRTYWVVAVTGDTIQIGEQPGGDPLEVTHAGTADATRQIRKCIAFTTQRMDSLLQQVYENGGITEEESRFCMVTPYLKRVLSYAYIQNRGYEEGSRTMGGVAVDTIKTDFGTLNVVVNRHMPAGCIAVGSAEELEPVWLQTDKGLLFMERLSIKGSREEYQFYGEFGLKYGNERRHGLITHLKASGPIA